jgi:hypothetical protein
MMKYLGAVSTRAAQSASGSMDFCAAGSARYPLALRTGADKSVSVRLMKQPLTACGWPSTDVAGIHSSWAE